MNFLKLFFSDIISIVMNLAMIAVAVVIYLRILNARKELEKNEKEIDRAAGNKTTRRELDKDANIQVVSGSTIGAKEMQDLHREFDQICVDCDTLSQLIPLFPTMGILGTVAGLMKQVSAEGLEQMTDSIGLALSTTCVAMLITLVLKFIMTVQIGKKVSEIEVKYMDDERQRRHLLDKAQLREEE